MLQIPFFYYYYGPRELFVLIGIILFIISINICQDFIFSISIDKGRIIPSNYFYRYLF